jgi:hypothetical protein
VKRPPEPRPYAVLTQYLGPSFELYTGRCNSCGRSIGVARPLALLAFGRCDIPFDSMRGPNPDTDEDSVGFEPHQCPAGSPSDTEGDTLRDRLPLAELVFQAIDNPEVAENHLKPVSHDLPQLQAVKPAVSPQPLNGLTVEQNRYLDALRADTRLSHRTHSPEDPSASHDD